MCTAPDGHIYSFPWIEQLGSRKEAIQAIGDIPYINKKWLDYLGLDVPTTTDELEQVLIAFRDHADELEQEFDIEGGVIPMSFIINNGDQDPAILMNGFGEGYGDTGDHFAVTDEGKVIYAPTQEGYKEGIEWLHKLVTEDLIDPEAFTQEWSTYVAKGKTTDTGSALHGTSQISITTQIMSCFLHSQDRMESEISPDRITVRPVVSTEDDAY